MKAMSDVGIRMNDCRYVDLWSEYRSLMSTHHKKTYVIAVLSSRYNLSERTIERIINRFSKEL